MGAKDADDSRSGHRSAEGARRRAWLAPRTTLLDGRFVIKRLLGSGGMGVVYEAEDRERGTTLALKTLSEVDASGIYGLKQEFRALADVLHPNLVGLHELFFDQEQWFFTMDLIPGDTLLDRLGERPDNMALRRAFAQLARGIQVIHDAGKLHRDLKPTNVLMTPDGRVVILDFGLASDQKEGGVGQTIVDENISGTPAYMAPEQAAAAPSSPASDWYAFGAMLFEALTGGPPFRGRGHMVLMRKQQEDAPRPSSFREGIPHDLEQLCIQLLRRDPNARPGWEQVMQVLGPVNDQLSSAVPQDEVPFVGRVEELAALQKAFEATDRGLPVALLVHGVSGVGKTALVEQFLASLQQQDKAVVLTGRCYERESVPYKACDSLIDALSRYLKQLPRDRAANLLPRQVYAIAQLFPALQRLDVIRNLKQRHPLPPDPNELRRVAFLAFKELLTNISVQEPLVLYIDDLQWSDVDGAKLITSILSRPEPPSLLLIGVYRSEEADTSAGLMTLRERLGELDETEVRDIELSELSEKESHQLASALLPDQTQDLAASIAQEAQGSPFLITELARYIGTGQALEEQPGLENAIKSRVAALTDGEREVLEAICVSGRPLAQGLLRAVAKKGDVAAALRRLQADHLVTRIGSGATGKVRTYHDRIRESLIACMDEEHLKLWHSRLAHSMESTEAPDFVALTEHFLGAGESHKAGACASEAADRAAETLAFESAARLYQMGLKLNPGDRENERCLQTRLGTALANAGRGTEAAQAFMLAAEGAPLADALELRQRAAYQWIITGHMNEGMRELDSVLRTVGLKLHSRPLASIVSLQTNRARIRLHGLNFRERKVEDVTKRDLLELRACWTVIQGLYVPDTLQAAAFCARFLSLALSSGIVEEVVRGLAGEAIYRSAEGVRKRPVVDELLKRAQQLGRGVQDPEVLATVQYAMGITAYCLGETFGAIEYLERAEKIFVEACTGATFYLSSIKIFLGDCYRFVGRWSECHKKWDVWIRDAQERKDLNLLTAQRTWPIGVNRWLAVDQADRARDQLSQGLAQWPWQSFESHNWRWNAAVSESFIHLYVGNYREAFDAVEGGSRLSASSPLRRIQIVRVMSAFHLAYAALGLAATVADRKRLLKTAQEQARKLAQERFPMAVPYVPYIEGCIAYLEGDEDKAAHLLGEAVREFETIRFGLYAVATSRQLGRVLGGDEGRALVAKADETMNEEGIVRPERVAAMLAPGFPE